MATVRHAAAAGSFYPADPTALRAHVANLLEQAVPRALDVEPRVLIVPHAGYAYSGPVAAAAYRVWQASPPRRRVVLLGPSHFVAFSGLATSGADCLATPLGEVPVDGVLTARAELDPLVAPRPAAHAPEHSLEVQLPFLQVALGEFEVLAMLTGEVTHDRAADVLDVSMAGDEVVAVISSDLSHYLPYEAAHRWDARTIAAIVELRAGDLTPHDACGRIAVQAALVLARRRAWACRFLAQGNSGDTAGPRDSVVGYAAFAIGPPA
ncbi:MAG TPA: AmmeMemoRadiSam system protein B [Actinobacteria bacterium]|nr:AmmeMemoRadiSam system protein B [Actinomycetota bacterium]